METRRTYKYRLYPKREQAEALDYQVSEARHLYNAALQERRDAYRGHGISRNYYDQCRELTMVRAAGDIGLVNAQVGQDVLRRVDKAFKAFFRRVKAGEKAGYPRFKGRDRFNSITFPSWGNGCHLTETGRVKVQGVGILKVKMHRPLVGQVKTLTIKREAGKWYACFSLVVVTPAPTAINEAIGIDVGLSTFAALSDGALIGNPRHYRHGQAALRVAQRRVSRRKKGSHRRRKAVQLLQKAHKHIKDQRSDFHHKVSRQIAKRYGLVAVEDLNVKGLARGMLAKSVSDAGWGEFLAKLAYKVEETGGQFVEVDPRDTSQVCSGCGCLPDVPKTLSDRVHFCPHCGLTLDRDVNAARNILALGLSVVGETWHSSACVPAEAVSLIDGVVTSSSLARTE